MIQLKTMLNCIDNSGAAVVECAKVLKMKRHAKIGDRIIVVVQKQRSFGPESGPGGSVSTSAANKSEEEILDMRWSCGQQKNTKDLTGAW